MVEPRDEPPTRTEPDGRADLLTVGLFVYFVALIVLVAGLLVLPALY
jgi:hypothetical protein